MATRRRAACRLVGAAGQDDLARIEARLERVEKNLRTAVNLNQKTLKVLIDSCNYWVWEALTVASPRVVVVEYNADFGTERAVTVPYSPAFDREACGDKRYYGASLPALVHLGARKGYRLVLVEPTGVNAFFVRNDVGRELPAVVPPTLPPEPSGEEDVFAACARLNLPLVDVDATDPS